MLPTLITKALTKCLTTQVKVMSCIWKKEIAGITMGDFFTGVSKTQELHKDDRKGSSGSKEMVI